MQLLTNGSDFSDSIAVLSSGSWIAIVPIAALADSDFSLAKQTSAASVLIKMK